MNTPIDRRRFIQTTATAAAAVGLSGSTFLPGASAGSEGAGFKKAVIVSPPDRAKLEEIKKAGFDGVEISVWGKNNQVTLEQAAETKKIADDLGLRVHTVLRGWAQFNDMEPQKVREDIEFTAHALRVGQAYGADAVLLVPGKVGGLDMPEKDGYAVQFEKETGRVTHVVEGNNRLYQKLIYAHNHAWEAFHKAIAELIPVAKETGVLLAVENVWNNLMLTPEHFALFIDSIDSPHVRAYYDVANHIAYGPPAEDWIKVLGKRIAKIHVKDYAVNPADGKTNWPNLREGDVNFPAVIEALKKEADYADGWLTIEGSGGLSYDDQHERLELIIAGK